MEIHSIAKHIVLWKSNANSAKWGHAGSHEFVPIKQMPKNVNYNFYNKDSVWLLKMFKSKLSLLSYMYLLSYLSGQINIIIIIITIYNAHSPP